MLEAIAFVARNLSYSVQNVRKLASVVSAMNKYRKEHPTCAWCGRPGVDVHHIVPLHVAPERAADPENFISLNRRPACHHILGHVGNWKTGSNCKVREMCGMLQGS